MVLLWLLSPFTFQLLLYWRRPFWDEAQLSFRHPRRHDFRVRHVYALTRSPTDRGWLSLSAAPPLANAFGLADDAAVIAAAMETIREMWKAPPDPTQAYVSKWGHDRFSGGSYSYIPVGATLQVCGVLLVPGRLAGRCPPGGTGPGVSGHTAPARTAAPLGLPCAAVQGWDEGS